MKYYSTNNKQHYVSLKEAVIQGLAPDNGLYMPERIDALPTAFINSLSKLTFQEIAFEVAHHLIKDDVDKKELERIINHTVAFDAPLVEVENDIYALELFHGPTMAFKDFGARFMARLMSYLNKDEPNLLTILVATSGDTGGAVADGFFGVEGIEVYILYPSGGVSGLQEKQLTTYGGNIHALEIEGTFDDCQRLVKSAFLDDDFNYHYRLSSANSINIARLIPQMVYYFSSWGAVSKYEKDIIFTVPSGNFGNLTAGLLAKRCGLPISSFFAATNVNKTVPVYLSGKGFTPTVSIPTISNAMDVGNPSNFGRMLDLYDNSLEAMQNEITAVSVTDQETAACINSVFIKNNYLADPHGAVGITAWNKLRKKHAIGIILETAHPAKFKEKVEEILHKEIPLPPELNKLIEMEKNAKMLPSDFSVFKEYMISLRKN